MADNPIFGLFVILTIIAVLFFAGIGFHIAFGPYEIIHREVLVKANLGTYQLDTLTGKPEFVLDSILTKE